MQALHDFTLIQVTSTMPLRRIVTNDKIHSVNPILHITASQYIWRSRQDLTETVK